MNTKTLINTKDRALSAKQIEDVYKYSESIIDNLSDKALSELIDGYGGDLDRLMNEILIQTNSVINFNGANVETDRFNYLEHLSKSIDEQFKVLSYNYFKSTCLTNFRQNWRNIEWGNEVQLYPWSAYLCQRGSGKSHEGSYAFPLWRLYSYKRPHPLMRDDLDNSLRKETCLITNESKLANLHIGKMVEEIKLNDILGAKINPNGKAELNKESIITESGAMLHKRSYGSFIRGLHVGAVVTDDFLDKSCLYSKDQRDKFKEVFYAEIREER